MKGVFHESVFGEIMNLASWINFRPTGVLFVLFIIKAKLSENNNCARSNDGEINGLEIIKIIIRDIFDVPVSVFIVIKCVLILTATKLNNVTETC